MEKDKYLTNAPKEEKISIQNDESYPNLKNVAGDSVDEHKNQEVANSLMAEKEIGQQRENL